MRTMSVISAILTFLAFEGYVLAETVTEGQLDIHKLATKITGDIQDYMEKRDLLVEDIRSTQKGIEKLRADFHSSAAEKERTIIRSRTLAETSRLLNLYDQFYKLNVEKVERILPELEKMRAAANKGSLGSTARALNDPEFRKKIENLYCNLSTLAILFRNPDVKKEIAGLLKENELLFRRNEEGMHAFEDIIRNTDKVSKYLRSVYARTVLRSRILEQKKFKTEMAIELMQYALALKPLKETMIMINPEGVIEVPEISLSEFVDPVIQGPGSSGEGADLEIYQEVDSTLKQFQSGPGFLK